MSTTRIIQKTLTLHDVESFLATKGHDSISDFLNANFEKFCEHCNTKEADEYPPHILFPKIFSFYKAKPAENDLPKAVKNEPHQNTNPGHR